MSAALRLAPVFGALALVGAGASYSFRQPGDFTKNALAAAEFGAPDVSAAAVKAKLPSNFFQFTLGNFKISNASA
ncbi:hypothetical protein BAUCODRAFT_146195 [Baudoinia panamericana UAMH 10762]|uniref:Uncharacterized protein n=1 Tax=Baudoinia panamericana (strain UAMH 10762) TaxID=717646 RepID=M2NJB1_BAUPA|nr:uncharacterized protein BAUCODRAFT_146195 [Baudoinia panamericana UAMH 10762]EMC99225.1 hypothetical protein BAUCODRAFT_146195 [Baudoinia panamericana UAMH 10762]